MPFAAAAAAVGVAGSVASAEISSQGAQDAARTQANAANAASQVQQNQFNQTQGNLSPFVGTGQNALAALSQQLGIGTTPGVNPQWANNSGAVDPATLNQLYQTLLGRPGTTADAQGWLGQPINQVYRQILSSPEFQQRSAQGISPQQATTTFDPNAPLVKPFTLADFQSSPAFKFQTDEGISAIDNSASARGITGNTLRDIISYGTEIGKEDYYNAYNVYTGRQNQIFNYLNTLAGSGQNAASGLGALGFDTFKQIGNDITGAGNALAAGQAGAANAFGRGLNNLSNITQQAFLSQQQPQPFDFTSSLVSAGNSPSILAGGGTVYPGTPPF